MAVRIIRGILIIPVIVILLLSIIIIMRALIFRASMHTIIQGMVAEEDQGMVTDLLPWDRLVAIIEGVREESSIREIEEMSMVNIQEETLGTTTTAVEEIPETMGQEISSETMVARPISILLMVEQLILQRLSTTDLRPEIPGSII